MTDFPATVVEALPYTEETVWSIQFVQSPPSATKSYLRTLSAEWKPLMDEAQRRGLIRSYRIMLSPPAHRDDWNVMIMIEVENMAALDGHNDRMIALINEVRGGGAGCGSLQANEGDPPPDFIALRLLREVSLR